MKNEVKKLLKKQLEISSDEKKIQQAIEQSKRAFMDGESRYSLSNTEFLYQQSRYIKKHWWLLQGILLLGVCMILYLTESDYYIRRCLGVAAPVFVVLVLPEFWKNRNENALEVEGTTLLTLRQIYAARMILFAGMDLILLTMFFICTSLTGRLTLGEMLIQFVLPFNVACGICFQCLYSNRIGSESLSVFLCFVWSGLWVMVFLNDAVYYTISIPIWGFMLSISFLYMGGCIYHVWNNWKNIWEVKPTWN